MKVAIIGASFARTAYLPALAHVPGANVVALASGRISSARAAADAFGIPAAYDDWAIMLDRHRPDLVLIATPTDTHAAMTLAALDLGAHVLCEKPTAMNAVEAGAMLDRARATGRLHMVDHELRFNPNRRRIATLIADGALGDIHHVQISNISNGWNDPASRPMGDWWSLAAQGGGRLGANGSHQVDLLRWWLGPAASVLGQARVMVPNRLDPATGAQWTATADDLTHFALNMHSGAVAQVFLSGVAAHGLGNLTQICGSDGTIVLNNDDEKLWFAKKGAGFDDITEPNPDAYLSGINPGIWNAGVVGALREMATAIAENRPLRQGATFADGLANQRILDGVLASQANRAWVDLPPEEPV